jgi:DNA end-binding protein Ku
MAPRPYWKGYLKLSLVSCPIALTPATSGSEKISFRQINKATGNRIRYKKVDSETEEEVASDQIGKGYEVAKNEYLIMDDEEFEAIQLESTHTIEIDRFVPFTQIDRRFYDQPYYVVPNDEVGIEAFAVIREAMVGKGMAALGRVVMNKRERIIAIEPHGKGMIGTTLHYAYEVRNADDQFDDIPDVRIAPDMLKLAQHIVEQKEGEFEPESFRDHYEEALIEVIKQKQAHAPVTRGSERPSASAKVVNLMDALRRSVANDAGTPPAGPKARKRTPGQGEMLMPIAGKKKAAAKETARPARRKAS